MKSIFFVGYEWSKHYIIYMLFSIYAERKYRKEEELIDYVMYDLVLCAVSRIALYLLVIIISYVIRLEYVLMANTAKYVKIYYKAYANVRLNVWFHRCGKNRKRWIKTYEDRLAYVGYIIMIDLNRCNGSDYNGLENISTFLF